MSFFESALGPGHPDAAPYAAEFGATGYDSEAALGALGVAGVDDAVLVGVHARCLFV